MLRTQRGPTSQAVILEPVEVPATWTKDYKTVIAKIKKEMEAKGLTKPEALALRAKFVEAQTS